MRLRSSLGKSVRWLARRAGYNIVSKNKFGHDVLADIRTLSYEWRWPIDIIFDVGANDGSTLVNLLATFPASRIIAFEPHRATYSRLKKRFSSYRRVEPHNCAVGDESCHMDFYEYVDSKINSLVPNAQYATRFSQAARSVTKIRAVSIDDFCASQKISSIDLLKIDTEGFDLHVIKGAEKALKRRAIKFITFEFNDIQPRSGSVGGALAPIDQVIRTHGLKLLGTYNDYLVTEGEPFGVFNALYGLPPTEMYK